MARSALRVDIMLPFVAVLLSPAGSEGGISGMQGVPGADPSRIPGPEVREFALSSQSFANGGVIPDRLAGEHGVSPQLSWTDPPKGTQRFVIIMDDPDAASVVGHTFVHWVAALPTRERSLPEGASGGGWTGKPKVLSGDSTSTPYRGPRPPSGRHRYHIAIYAMGGSFRNPDFQDLAHSAAANDTRTYTRQHFESLFRSDILAFAELAGTYSAAPHLGR